MTIEEEHALAATQRIKGLPNPGEGYRLLLIGEIIQNGDEYFFLGEWRTSTGVVSKIMWKQNTYRRKLSS